MKFKMGDVSTFDRSETVDIICKPRLSLAGTISALGITVCIYVLATSCMKAGARSYEKAEFEALEKVHVIEK